MDGWSGWKILFVEFFYGSNLRGLAGLGERADCTCDLSRTSNAHFFVCVCVRRSALSKVTNFQSVSGLPNSPFFMRRVRGKSVQSVKSSVLSYLFLRAMSIAGIVGCCRVGKTRKLSVGLPTSHDFFFFSFL